MVLNAGTAHEQRRPFEIFINSKNMDHFQWIVALTRIMSAVFRKGGDCTFLVENSRRYSTRAGLPEERRHLHASIVAEIGGVLERHLTAIGLLRGLNWTRNSVFPRGKNAPPTRPPGHQQRSSRAKASPPARNCAASATTWRWYRWTAAPPASTADTRNVGEPVRKRMRFEGQADSARIAGPEWAERRRPRQDVARPYPRRRTACVLKTNDQPGWPGPGMG